MIILTSLHCSAYCGKHMTLIVRTAAQGRQTEDFELWSHMNETIATVRRHIVQRYCFDLCLFFISSWKVVCSPLEKLVSIRQHLLYLILIFVKLFSTCINVIRPIRSIIRSVDSIFHPFLPYVPFPFHLPSSFAFFPCLHCLPSRSLLSLSSLFPSLTFLPFFLFPEFYFSFLALLSLHHLYSFVCSIFTLTNCVFIFRSIFSLRIWLVICICR